VRRHEYAEPACANALPKRSIIGKKIANNSGANTPALNIAHQDWGLLLIGALPIARR
jgi:hypothetical protein